MSLDLDKQTERAVHAPTGFYVVIETHRETFCAKVVRAAAWGETTMRVRRIDGRPSELVLLRDVENAHLASRAEVQAAAEQAHKVSGTGSTSQPRGPCHGAASSPRRPDLENLDPGTATRLASSAAVPGAGPSRNGASR
jgi:hypothetical protein